MTPSMLSRRTICGRPDCTNELSWERRTAHQKYCSPECARLDAQQITPQITPPAGTRPRSRRSTPSRSFSAPDHICALHLVDLVDPSELETLADRLQQHPDDPDHAYRCASEWLRQEANRRREGRY